MEVTEALRRRRMVRSFDGSEIDPDVVLAIFDDALRAPTAGNARGVSWVVLVGQGETARYFDATTDATWRESSRRAEGLARASAVGVCVTDPMAYVARYAEADKRASGLGDGPDAWPIPYWYADAGASMMSALLRAQDEGLGAAFLGSFRGQTALKESLDIPRHLEIFGAVLLGRPDGNDTRSPSLDHAGPERSERLHRSRYAPT